MPWYNEEAVTEYDLDAAKALMEEAGWIEGDDGIREKDGEKAELTIMFSNGDSVRQALAEDSANQLRELGIDVTTSGVGWDTAYDQAQSEPLIWGWGALWSFTIFITPSKVPEVRNILHMQMRQLTNTWTKHLQAATWKNPTISGKKPSGTEPQELHRKGIFRGSGCAILIIFILYVMV